MQYTRSPTLNSTLINPEKMTTTKVTLSSPFLLILIFQVALTAHSLPIETGKALRGLVQSYPSAVNLKPLCHVENGPFTGWTAYGAETDTVVWHKPDGSVGFWAVDSCGNRISNRDYSPFPGYSIQKYIRRPGGSRHSLWTTSDSKISIWKMDNRYNQVSYKEYGPFPGWLVVDYARNGLLLWRYAANNKASVWVVNDNNIRTSFTEYGPFPDWTPLMISSNFLLWQHSSGRISLWKMSSSGQQLTYQEHGPFPGWVPVSMSDSRILWKHIAGGVSVWTMNPNTLYPSTIQATGPIIGWSPLAISDDEYGNSVILWTHTTGTQATWRINAAPSTKSPTSVKPVATARPTYGTPRPTSSVAIITKDCSSFDSACCGEDCCFAGCINLGN